MLLRELAHGIVRALARVARVLDAAVGHLVGAEGRGLVDGDAAEFEPSRPSQLTFSSGAAWPITVGWIRPSRSSPPARRSAPPRRASSIHSRIRSFACS